MAGPMTVRVAPLVGGLTPEMAFEQKELISELFCSSPHALTKRSQLPEYFFQIIGDTGKILKKNYADIVIWSDEMWQAAGKNQPAFVNTVPQRGLLDIGPQVWFFKDGGYPIPAGLIPGVPEKTLFSSCIIVPVSPEPDPDAQLLTSKGVGIYDFRRDKMLISMLVLIPYGEGQGTFDTTPYLSFCALEENNPTDPTSSQFLAALEFMQSKLVVSVEHRMNRGARKVHGMAGSKATKKEPRIRSIDLRRRVYAPKEGDAAEQRDGAREYSCQWFVDSHVRKQFYPSEGVYKTIRIEEYIKGPEDKPLKPKGKKLYRVVR